ncbi:MAG: hypothetical protein U1F10_04970 [Burkholderiales bacterium]
MNRRRFLQAAVAGAAWPACAARAQARAAMQPFDAAAFAALHTRFAGRAFVLAFWSVHCAPCLDDMATWRTLQARFPGVPIVLVATDPPAEDAAVRRALQRFSPGKVELWAFADDFAERTRYAVDRKWRGELPRTYFYDRAHAAEVISGRVEPATAAAWCERMR